MRNEVVVKHYAICMTTTSAELLKESYNNRNVNSRSCHILFFKKQNNSRVHYLFTIYLCIYLAKKIRSSIIYLLSISVSIWRKNFGRPLSIYYLFVYLSTGPPKASITFEQMTQPAIDRSSRHRVNIRSIVGCVICPKGTVTFGGPVDRYTNR
jgi:hypothetical protein